MLATKRLSESRDPILGLMPQLLQRRDLVFALVARDLKVRYRRSAIGFGWTMLQPLLTMLVLTLVFSSVFRLEAANYPVFALSGLVFWNYLQQSTMAAMNSLRGHAQVLQRLPVPRWVFPLATVLAGLVNLLCALVPLGIIVLATGHPVRPSLFFLPVSILIATMLTLGIALVVSPMAVFFSDVVEIIGVFLTLLLYATPVFYPKSIVPESYRWLVRFNPIRSVLEVFRDPIYYGKVPPVSHLIVAGTLAFLLLLIGVLLFRRISDRIPFHV
jgi:ABC-type polysaccharide/polyol phosphate export permease